jgi:hypothetical protein
MICLVGQHWGSARAVLVAQHVDVNLNDDNEEIDFGMPRAK